jgi:hypothetical protein
MLDGDTIGKKRLGQEFLTAISAAELFTIHGKIEMYSLQKVF